jgi:hypothetical protein
MLPCPLEGPPINSMLALGRPVDAPMPPWRTTYRQKRSEVNIVDDKGGREMDRARRTVSCFRVVNSSNFCCSGLCFRGVAFWSLDRGRQPTLALLLGTSVPADESAAERKSCRVSLDQSSQQDRISIGSTEECHASSRCPPHGALLGSH